MLLAIFLLLLFVVGAWPFRELQRSVDKVQSLGEERVATFTRERYQAWQGSVEQRKLVLVHTALFSAHAVAVYFAGIIAIWGFSVLAVRLGYISDSVFGPVLPWVWVLLCLFGLVLELVSRIGGVRIERKLGFTAGRFTLDY